MRSRNIKLGYWLVALNNAFFWYAPWLLFVYQYIDIQQATVLQLIGMVIRIVSEVPTGTICDLLGKKKTLMVAFFLTAVGETTMAFSTNFIGFTVAYVIINFGYSFYSGTMDAFTYDSLAETNDLDQYPKVLSRSNAYLNLSTAVATIAGGFLFRFWGGLPFLVTGMTKFLGLIVTFFITEPKVDTYVFSLVNFVEVTKKGFKQLFSKRMMKFTVLLLIIGAFSTVTYEILDDAAVVNWGYGATGISILYTSLLVFSIPSSFVYDKIAKKIKSEVLVILAILLLGLNYLLAPWLDVYVWTGLFFLRVIYSPIKKAVVTDILNQHTDSNIRATTLSTYELVIKLPFVILGVPIGMALKVFGVRSFSVLFSVLLFLSLAIYLLFKRITVKNRNNLIGTVK